MKCLIVEDDNAIGALLRRGLEAAGHNCEWTQTGAEALALALGASFDAVVLDVRLPDVDGMEFCERLREQAPHLSILILSAMDRPEDRIKGLNCGADDYLVKPFVFDELLARLIAIRRRSAIGRPAPPARADAFQLDAQTRVMSHDGGTSELTAREFKLLEYLLKNRNKVVTRAAILSQVWGANADISDNAIDVYVGYLRKKLDLSARLVTVRGVGFKLSA